MTTLTLKSYQQAALDALRAFARAAQLKGPAMAFGEQVGRPYNPDPFGEVPCICLRIPTGGGKTLMAAHAVNVLAQEWRATDAPVALWLVPSDNLATAPCGFALATSRGRFFPDFVAELLDGRIAVVEYKGAHLLNDPYEIEKRQVGELWARKSNKRCLFGQIARVREGVGMPGQLDALLV